MIGQNDIRFAPIIISERLKQAAVQKRNAAVESFAPCVVSTIRSERVVEQRLKNIIEKVLIIAVLASRQAWQKIVRAGAPVFSFLNAEPAFFLDEIKKYNLAH